MAELTVTKGSMIGRYRAAERLSTGGMGQVWLAHEEHVNKHVPPRLKPRSVALKILLNDDDDESDAALAAEGALMGHFTHQNIPRLYEIGTHAFRPGKPTTFLAMEFIGGFSLRKLCQVVHESGRLFPFEVIATIIYEIADALLYIFDTPWGDFHPKLVHRDVSTKNVIVTRKGRVVLVDYGIAAGVRDYTNQKPPVGTLATMAPEQFTNEVTPLVDAYGTGTVLWSVLESKPFRGGMSHEETYEMALRGEYFPLRRTGIPPVLLRACEALLAPDPRARMTLDTLRLELEQHFGCQRAELIRFMERVAGSESWRSGMTGVHPQGTLETAVAEPALPMAQPASAPIGPYGTNDAPTPGTDDDAVSFSSALPTLRKVSPAPLDVPLARKFVRTEPYSMRLMAERIDRPMGGSRTEPLPPTAQDSPSPRTAHAATPEDAADVPAPRPIVVTAPSAVSQDTLQPRPQTVTEPSPRGPEPDSRPWVGAPTESTDFIDMDKVVRPPRTRRGLAVASGLALLSMSILGMLIGGPRLPGDAAADVDAETTSIAVEARETTAAIGTPESPPIIPQHPPLAEAPVPLHAPIVSPAATPETMPLDVKPPVNVDAPAPEPKKARAPAPLVRVILHGEQLPFADVKIGRRRFELDRKTFALMLPAGWTPMSWRLDRKSRYRKARSCWVEPGYTYEVTVTEEDLHMSPCHPRKPR